MNHVKNGRRKIRELIVSTDSFKSILTQRTYFMRPSDLKGSSENLFYLLTSETCSKQYRGSTEDFWPMFSNYRSSHRNVLERKKC